jgi:hypothetical protein
MIKKTVVALSVATLATGAVALPEAQARDVSTVQVATCTAACNPCNPCAAAACNPCNPCSVVKPACNPCNPCAAAAGCNPCNPCNPCAASN